MNYLAHAWVSKSYSPFMLGQLLGDFAIRSEIASTHEDLRRGVEAHRALDTYTDAHPAFREGCRLLAPYCYRYAPVVMDVLIDHVLVTHWAELNASATPLEGFFEQVYQAIDRHAWNLPERMRTPAIRMLQSRWFPSLSTRDGTAAILSRMVHRVRRREWMEAASEGFFRNYDVIIDAGLTLLADPNLQFFQNDFFSIAEGRGLQE